MPEMTIAQIQSHKTELEARLRNVAAEVVDEFQRRTGLMVNNVDVRLRDVSTAGGPDRTAVTEVRLDIRL